MTGPPIGRRSAVWTAAVVLGLTSGGLTGAGAVRADDDIDTLSARQIADRSREALLSAHSLHLSTRGDFDGRGTSTTVDLVLDRDGNCNGSLHLGRDRGSVRIVRRGDTVWIKPDAVFWKRQAPDVGDAFAAILASHYTKGSASDPRLRNLASTCDLDTFRNAVSGNATKAKGTLTKGRKTTLGGASVIPLVRMDKGRKLTMYVSATGKPYPLRITATGGSPKANATMNFSAFDKPVPTATPSPEETFDIDEAPAQAT